MVWQNCSRISVANVGTDSLRVHVHTYSNDPIDKSTFKRIKTFLINVTCLFSNSFVFRKCTHLWSYYLWTRICTYWTDLQLYVYLERRYMYMYFEKVNIVFYSLWSILTLLEHLKIISRTKELAHACTVSSCAHKGCTCSASSVECQLWGTWVFFLGRSVCLIVRHIG